MALTWLKFSDVKAGDKIQADRGFTCIAPNAVLEVRSCDHGLYVNCDEGKHFLDGQENADGFLVGLSAAPVTP